MARTKNPLLIGFKVRRGSATKGLTVKMVKGTCYIIKSPDMSNVVPSSAQLYSNSKFAEAVRFARSIIHDPAKKAAYKARKGSTVYHSAIKDYMER